VKLFKGKKTPKAGDELAFPETLKALLADAQQQHQLRVNQILQLGLKDLGVPDGVKIQVALDRGVFVVKE
jgi:hypothetical protein